jgi:hypothetical protein
MAALYDALVQQILAGRYSATLATQNPDGSLHMVAVWFWSDGQRIYVATSQRTRKARNLEGNPKIAIMIDSRDPAASFGVNIAGTAGILRGDEARQRNQQIHGKYLSAAALADPQVGSVFAYWDDITIEITPASLIAWDMREADRQVFAGAFAAHASYLLPTARSRRPCKSQVATAAPIGGAPGLCPDVSQKRHCPISSSFCSSRSGPFCPLRLPTQPAWGKLPPAFPGGLHAQTDLWHLPFSFARLGKASGPR